MTTTLEGRLHIDSWDENPYREHDDGRKFSKAAVVLSADGASADGVTAASFDSVLFYRPDGTSHFVAVMSIDGTLGGRTGSFALSGNGSYQDETARMNLDVIPGSGTGELAGLTGSLESASTHADYPYMPFTLRYELG